MSNKALGCLILMVALAVLLAAGLLALDQWSRSQPPDAWKGRDASVDAWRMMEKFVAKQLKAPGSATFPEVSYATRYRDHVTREGASQRYRVKGWVDAQNSFGAMMRTTFSGEVEQVADGQWRLLTLEFGP